MPYVDKDYHCTKANGIWRIIIANIIGLEDGKFAIVEGCYLAFSFALCLSAF